MLSTYQKRVLARKVQDLLQEIDDDELPLQGEIHFILHIDGAEDWSWANIRNEQDKLLPVPNELIGNLQFLSKK